MSGYGPLIYQGSSEQYGFQRLAPRNSLSINGEYVALPSTRPSRPMGPSSIDLGASDSVKGSELGDSLRIFWPRTFCCVLVAPLLTIYYAIIWHLYLKSYDPESPVIHGVRGGRWVYYSWFILSAVGINLSKYGLAGVEAGMLMNRRWAARNAMQLIMHCDKTWSGPSGWITVGLKSRRGKFGARPSPSWYLLATVSVLPFIALPLSGLTMELTEGVKPGTSGRDRAELSGQNRGTFADQTPDVIPRAFNRWRYAVPLQLSRRSAFYIPEATASLQNRTWLRSIPNEWPDDDMSTVFLAPQSDRPVVGQVWGLQSSYNCTTITHIDQYQLLSQRSEDKSTPRCPAIDFASYGGSPQYYGLPELCDHDIFLIGQREGPGQLVRGSLEIGTLGFLDGFMEMAVKYEKKEGDQFSDTSPVLMEMAVWQNPVKLDRSCRAIEREVSNNLSSIVEGMQKTYIDHSPYDSEELSYNTRTVLLDAIGVQCTASFMLGTATLDGLKGTYASFTQEEPVPTGSATSIPLATAIPEIIRSSTPAALELTELFSYLELQRLVSNLTTSNGAMREIMTNPIPEIASQASWLVNLFKSVNAYSRVSIPCDEEGNAIDPSNSFSWRQLKVMTSAELKKSVIRAHQSYAIEISNPKGGVWYGNLTNTVPTTVIVPGKLPAIAVFILLAVWALCCIVLGITFGTRSRWADILDGFSMFRFGSDNPGLTADNVCVKDYDQCPTLLTIPGLIGDSKPGTNPGHITLVRNVIARSDKTYQGPYGLDDQALHRRRKQSGPAGKEQ